MVSIGVPTGFLNLHLILSGLSFFGTSPRLHIPLGKSLPDKPIGSMHERPDLSHAFSDYFPALAHRRATSNPVSRRLPFAPVDSFRSPADAVLWFPGSL